MTDYLVPIDKINIGERRREEHGDVVALVENIRKYGQLHPITLTDGNLLVDGARRIEAAKKMGWQQIEARYIEELSEAELRELELTANTTAKPFLQFELDKTMIKKFEEIANDIEAERNFDDFESSKKNGRGRPKSKKATTREIAEKAGVDQSTVVNTRKHVEAGDKYPDLLKVYTRKGDRTKAAKKLDGMSEEERAEACARLAQGYKLNSSRGASSQLKEEREEGSTTTMQEAMEAWVKKNPEKPDEPVEVVRITKAGPMELVVEWSDGYRNRVNRKILLDDHHFKKCNHCSGYGIVEKSA